MERAEEKRSLPLKRLESCPICGGTELDPYKTRPSLFNPGETISYDRCRSCSTVFRNPRPEDLARLEVYQERPVGDVDVEVGWSPRSRRHYRFVVERMRRLGMPDGAPRILDFGCGAGGFLQVAVEMGLEAEGLEVARDLAEHTERRVGVRVFKEPIPHPGYPDRPFSAVFSSMVFEHLTDPLGVLKALRGMVIPGGLAVLEIPNALDFRERLRRGSTLDDSHLFYFSRRGLARLFQEAGFRLLRTEEGLRIHTYLESLGMGLPFTIRSSLERLTHFARLDTALTAYARAVGPPAGKKGA
jgi:SAM-dependent methyltransferase